MEFKPGDKVVVDFDGDPEVIVDMEKYIGRVFTIARKYHLVGGYELEEDGGEYLFAGRWLRPADAKEKKTKAKKKKTNGVSKRGIQKAIAKARNVLRENARHMTCCSYAKVVIANGKIKVESQVNDICHARMGSCHPVVALIDYLGEPKERFPSPRKYKEYLKFADYIINRSWISHAFHPTTIQNYIRNGVMMNVDVTATEVFAGLVSLRQGSERKERITDIFPMLVSLGYTEDFAFLMCLTFEPRGSGKYLMSIPYGHSPIAPSCEWEKVVQIALGKVRFENDKPYKEKSTDWKLFKTFGFEYGKHLAYKDTYGGVVTDIVLKYSKKKGWGDQELPGYLTKEQFLSVVKEISDKIGAKV